MGSAGHILVLYAGKPVDFVGAFRPDRLLRDVQICVVITCYNEDAEELRETLQGLAANLDGLDDLGFSWKQVQVCVIVDGLSKASESMLVYLEDELKMYVDARRACVSAWPECPCVLQLRPETAQATVPRLGSHHAPVRENRGARATQQSARVLLAHATHAGPEGAQRWQAEQPPVVLHSHLPPVAPRVCRGA